MSSRRGITAGMAGAISIALVLSVAGGAVGAKKKNKLKAELSGAKEVPPADPDGTGTAKVKLKKKKQEVCFKVSFKGIQEPFAAHIHKGGAGVNGPIKVSLFVDAARAAGVTSPVSGCVEDVKKKLIKKIRKKPKKWYVNVHNDDYPAGAIRGQLKRGGGGSGGGGGGGSNGGGGGGGDPLPY